MQLNLEWLRKQARHHLTELRKTDPNAKLADAQLAVARENGFSSWRALKAHLDSLTVDGQLFGAARTGDVATLTELLDRYPDKLQARDEPYAFTLLHAAAREGQLAVVDLLLRRGLDPNVREQGDNTYPMHWAAAAGKLDVVRRLADAGGDVIGKGDDHEVEVIGWASCWEGDDDAHRGVVDFLLSRGARHHIFSAVAMNLADEVRRIVVANPAAVSARLSRNENHQTPLHFAVGHNRPQIVALLVELGADPLAADGFGFPPAMYATSPDIDRPVMSAIHALTAGELRSADRGIRATRGGAMDLLAVVALCDWAAATRLVRDNPELPRGGGVLHLATKRGDTRGVRWLLEQRADPNARWAHWDSDVTALHLAALANHPEIVPILLEAGADPTIRDTKHDSDALGWAEFLQRGEIVELLKARSVG